MNKKLKAAALLTALIMSSAVFGGCSFNNPAGESERSSYSSSSSDSQISENEESVSEPSETADESRNSWSEESNGNSPADESSEEESSEEESAEESSSDEESSNDEESSAPSGTDVPEPSESSVQAYQFDDEQIINDYHTAKEFTSNEDFNQLFEKNAIDVRYNDELQNAGSTADMRAITAKYGNEWKTMAESVFNTLDELLSDNAEEKQKLEDSQNSWIEGLGSVESSFYEEAKEGGTEELLAAETAILNYYKGRAAVLLEQIYRLNGGSVDLGSYGL
ncbi:MAG: hypothetical protein IJ861_00510 [Clostridia bacterium]|nr:hypothetical protein [Clostridia bacterium]